jgi:hypothetical protein
MSQRFILTNPNRKLARDSYYSQKTRIEFWATIECDIGELLKKLNLYEIPKSRKLYIVRS